MFCLESAVFQQLTFFVQYIANTLLITYCTALGSNRCKKNRFSMQFFNSKYDQSSFYPIDKIGYCQVEVVSKLRSLKKKNGKKL